MTSSSGFKEKKSWHSCLPRARMNMKNTKETVYHCDNSCEMFVQFDVSFWDLYLLYALPVFFIIFGRITKLIVKKSGVVPVKSGVVSLQSLAGQNSEAKFIYRSSIYTYSSLCGPGSPHYATVYHIYHLNWLKYALLYNNLFHFKMYRIFKNYIYSWICLN